MVVCVRVIIVKQYIGIFSLLAVSCSEEVCITAGASMNGLVCRRRDIVPRQVFGIIGINSLGACRCRL